MHLQQKQLGTPGRCNYSHLHSFKNEGKYLKTSYVYFKCRMQGRDALATTDNRGDEWGIKEEENRERSVLL